jgi:hypothetical protein
MAAKTITRVNRKNPTAMLGPPNDPEFATNAESLRQQNLATGACLGKSSRTAA